MIFNVSISKHALNHMTCGDPGSRCLHQNIIRNTVVIYLMIRVDLINE